MNLTNLENIYLDINKEIEKITNDIRTNQDVKKSKDLDAKIRVLTQSSMSIGKLMTYYKFTK